MLFSSSSSHQQPWKWMIPDLASAKLELQDLLPLPEPLCVCGCLQCFWFHSTSATMTCIYCLNKTHLIRDLPSKPMYLAFSSPTQEVKHIWDKPRENLPKSSVPQSLAVFCLWQEWIYTVLLSHFTGDYWNSGLQDVHLMWVVEVSRCQVS